MSPRFLLSALVLGAALTPLAVACGGTTNSGASRDASADSGHHADSGADASGKDSGADASGKDSGADASGKDSGADASGKDAGSDASGKDSGADASGKGDAGAIPCDGSTCRNGQVCVVTTASGGACALPDDAGLCPNGKPGTPGQCCDNTTITYACKTLPPSCNGKLACPCASSLCQCGGCNLADAGTLACACMYP